MEMQISVSVFPNNTHDHGMSDPGLEALSEQANANEEAACPVTLVVNGNLVTGHIVGKSVFETDTTKMVEMAREQAGAENGAVDAMDDLISGMMGEIEDDDSGRHVHVSVQEVMTGAEAIHLGGSVFRFQADEVEGFTIGTVETKEG
ncbi:MAG: hypothetical protein BRD55_01700 [Bacteroidetes bacterium SW_9_63_38]|nr:MAG: hypothetical protein BRD55_01700 [Bacteroidetes bacterium SW_9_63_38]